MENRTEGTVRRSLSIKLLKVVLIAACFLGISLSFIQVLFDAHQSSVNIDFQAHQMLTMIHGSSVQAASQQNSHMAKDILNGLFQHQSVHAATIRMMDESELSSVKRGLSKSRYRLVSDAILKPVRTYHLPLKTKNKTNKTYGELLLAVDTAHHGKDLIQRSVIIMMTGVIRAILMALLLYAIYSWLLTKPLNKLIYHLSKINPNTPGKCTLPMPHGHHETELGLWVKTANYLLESIERNLNLRQKAEAQIMRLSQYDYLTRLPNRKTLQKHLQKVISKQESKGESIAILCLGLDDFKSLNAQFNFNAAEHILVKIADRIQTFIGNKAYVGRLGEDQFAIILTNVQHPYDAAVMAQDLLKELKRPFEINSDTISVSATVGITLFPDDGDAVDNLLQQAEFAMILAKSRSRNRYQFYVAKIDTEIRQRRKLERDLHNALENHEFMLFYQPQIDYKTRGLVGVEALIRWKHPENGIISPDMFIPMAEDNMDIIPIGDWVLETACHQLHQWQKTGHSNLRMSVNLSAIQLKDKNISERIQYILSKYHIDPTSFEIEVTETCIMEDIALSSEQLNKIKKIGVNLSLDDFGTGYSSLSYLKQFKFDKIKIDKSFVEGLPDDKENLVIVEAIIQLGKSFGIEVIAEGVENHAQERQLIKSGCREGQGYSYGKPMSPAELTELLVTWRHLDNG